MTAVSSDFVVYQCFMPVARSGTQAARLHPAFLGNMDAPYRHEFLSPRNPAVIKHSIMSIIVMYYRCLHLVKGPVLGSLHDGIVHHARNGCGHPTNAGSLPTCLRERRAGSLPPVQACPRRRGSTDAVLAGIQDCHPIWRPGLAPLSRPRLLLAALQEHADRASWFLS